MRWATELLANILVEDELLPNHYAISVDFDCETEDICLQNIGFERIKFFFEDMLEHVIICNKNSKFLKAFGKLNTNLMLLPGDPNDQLVLWCMYHKLSSILENNFIVDGMKLDSCQGDSIEYYYDGSLVDIEEINKKWVISDKLEVNPWYFRNDHALYDATISRNKQIAIYVGERTWDDVGLDWVTIDQLAKQPKGKVVKPKQFQLKVIDGKKNGKR